MILDPLMVTQGCVLQQLLIMQSLHHIPTTMPAFMYLYAELQQQLVVQACEQHNDVLSALPALEHRSEIDLP